MKLSVITGTQEPEATDPPSGHTQMTSLVDNLEKYAVGRFADAAARTTAIPAPAKGQLSVLTDSNRLEIYTGSAWQTPSDAPAIRVRQNSVLGLSANVDTIVPLTVSEYSRNGGVQSGNGLNVPATGLYSVSAYMPTANAAGNAGIVSLITLTIWRNPGGNAVLRTQFNNPGIWPSMPLNGQLVLNASDNLYVSVAFQSQAAWLDPAAGLGGYASLAATMISR